jgi:hypothetical protein
MKLHNLLILKLMDMEAKGDYINKLGLREVPTNLDFQHIKARVWQPSITTINAAA